MAYNGWTNYETWAVKLWMDNDEGSQKYWEGEAKHATSEYDLARQLKTEFAENSPIAEDASVYSDLLTAALGEVNWDEIAAALWADTHEEEEEEPPTCPRCDAVLHDGRCTGGVGTEPCTYQKEATA